MGKIRTLHEKPDTLNNLHCNWLTIFQKVEMKSDLLVILICTTTKKAAEHKTRRENRAIIIKSTKSKIPAHFQTFVKNDDNKTRIIDSLIDYIIKHRTKVLDILRCMNCFSKYNRRQSISLSSVGNVFCLCYEQEEADTIILRHCQYKRYKKMHILLSGHHQAIET